MNSLYKAVMDKLVEKTGVDLKSNMKINEGMTEKIFVIPPARVRYLSEIAESNRGYNKKATDQVAVAQKLFGIYKTIDSIISIDSTSIKTLDILTKAGLDQEKILQYTSKDEVPFIKLLCSQFDKIKMDFDSHNWEIILNWQEKIQRYKDPIYTYKVRNKEINLETHS